METEAQVYNLRILIINLGEKIVVQVTCDKLTLGEPCTFVAKNSLYLQGELFLETN